jgi:ferric-dicitrate binding protein FerR (iron transport regulator)
MEDGKDFKVLFKKWQERKINSAEKQQLMQLIESCAYNEELTRMLAEFHESDVDDNVIYSNDEEAAYEQLMANIHGIQSLKFRNENGRKLTPIRIAAIAASFIFLAGLVIYLFRTIGLPDATSNITTFADKQYFRLPDGTAVTLNENSSLSYDQEFGNKVREVTLTGEAFFDVAHAPNRPFVVRTRKINTTVLGTAFNINSFTTKVVVTVMRGKVKVSSGRTVMGELAPNEAITINEKSMQFKKSVVDAGKAVVWKANHLVMDEVTMKQAADLIEKHFNVNVRIATPALEKCTISAFFIKGESLDEVLEAISLAKIGSYTLKDGVATISGKCE